MSVPVRLTLPPGAVRKLRLSGVQHEFKAGEVYELDKDTALQVLAKVENDEHIFERCDSKDDTDILAALGVQLEWKNWPLSLR